MKIKGFTLDLPVPENTVPLVFDSPHSGTEFPDDFSSPVSSEKLLTAWDAFVEDLWAPAVSQGASLLKAHFPRVYIDPNRAPDDVDARDVDGTLPFTCKPTVYSERGMGLIRKFALPGIPMYETPLTAKQIMDRIDTYYTPYHTALTERLETLHQTFGSVWHIDCHSMKSKGNAMNIDNGQPRPDIVLGDGDGTTCEEGFIAVIEDSFRSKGYSVSRNVPYKGGYLIRHYAAPTRNRHSMQIEINRAVYMDEQAFKPNNHYQTFKQDLSDLTKELCAYIRDAIDPSLSTPIK
ncbi:N-formylglutamate amidohydrolase [Kordiimonas sediminis]|uniref:N-formylglutamate amidohydrolase n=1 Tax=Kordiimonas sediminis TaxID=1735581 RepID=A0A919ANM3_9PROT|nr:N-formylglutamate amidohydrolase [Kordiimonas sediminis]GHF17471.1 N-formylglutamate amidohydrolase [Kordiimonas sediminis]